MSADVEGFLQESTGVNGDAPWNQAETIPFAAYQDAVNGAVQAQKTIVAQAHELAEVRAQAENALLEVQALHATLDDYRTRVTAKAYLVIDLTKELTGLRQENQNLRDELERLREERYQAEIARLRDITDL